jgi:hypothetical protein
VHFWLLVESNMACRSQFLPVGRCCFQTNEPFLDAAVTRSECYRAGSLFLR